MVRTPCCKAEGIKKGAWTQEEDQKLIAYVQLHGEGGWRTLPDKAGILFFLINKSADWNIQSAFLCIIPFY